MKQDEKSPIPNNSTDLFKYKTAIKEQAKKTNNHDQLITNPL